MAEELAIHVLCNAGKSWASTHMKGSTGVKSKWTKSGHSWCFSKSQVLTCLWKCRLLTWIDLTRHLRLRSSWRQWLDTPTLVLFTERAGWFFKISPPKEAWGFQLPVVAQWKNTCYLVAVVLRLVVQVWLGLWLAWWLSGGNIEMEEEFCKWWQYSTLEVVLGWMSKGVPFYGFFHNFSKSHCRTFSVLSK